MYLRIFSLANYDNYSIKVNKQDVYKNLEFEKEVGIAIKSKQTSN